MDNEENESVEYVTAMEYEAMTANEMFRLYSKAGFSENQALKLIAFITVANLDSEEEEVENE